MPNGTSWAEATLNSKKIKLIVFAVIELHLSEGISQSVSQSVRQSVENSVNFFFKICSNLLKAFQVDLKACLGLVLPNQYCLIVIREKRQVFG